MDVYAVKHKDDLIVSKSRSGGMFTAITDFILKNNGVVYGCILDDDLVVKHVRADSFEIRDKMRGSKYVQSKLGDTFRSVKKDLGEGLQVAFSGTSCQIAGLKSFLGNKYENIIYIGIVCHGVPSPLILKEYLDWISKREHSHIISVDFRNKLAYGWRAHIETLNLQNGNAVYYNYYTKLFYRHEILRPACYCCKYKSINRIEDVSIADFWGIENVFPELDDDKGVSLVLVNTEKGMRLLSQIKENILIKETVIEKCMQPALIAPFPKPDDREEFWNDYKNKSFLYILRKYAGLESKQYIKDSIKFLFLK